ncbi:unnamed protein product [Echinostoma caproni]|uniref:TAP-C domain-containing protein n=1 Tax=Echinostoma caproni TaxID=27848 RepID=A0A183AVR1_9TREM|nr:unnamed protein product [Echinostoma caproni]
MKLATAFDVWFYAFCENGQDVPPTIQFAVERESGRKPNTDTPRIPLPDSVLGYFPSDAVRMPLLGFLKEYFTRFDTQPRGENILSYYTSCSRFVISTSTEPRCGPVQHGSSPHTNTAATARIETVAADGTVVKIFLTTNRLSPQYFARSRNLLRCRDEYRRRDLVTCGPVSIAAFLDELPATEHPLESFTVDVIFHSDTQILFTVTGVFYEVHSVTPASGGSNAQASPVQKTVRKTLRCFSRTMILVAPGGHIIQDDLIVSNPSPLLCKRYISEVAAKAQSSSGTGNATSSSSTAVQPTVSTGLVPPNPATQVVVLNEMRARSGMNEAFARQCLDEYAWNLDQALNAFHALNSAGKIPPNAFT